MATFSLRVPSPLPADAALTRLLDPTAHTRAIPLTTLTGRMDAVGSRFVARTRLGPWGLDDPMVVRSLTRGPDGGVLVIAKEGSVVRGTVTAQVRADGIGSVVAWRQDIAVGRVPRLLDPLVAAVARIAYGAALRRIVR